MFKIRELIVQTSISITGLLLRVFNSNLYFNDKQLATLSGDNILPGMILTINEDGQISQVSDVSKVSIHIDPTNGDDTGYGSALSPFATLDKALESALDYKMFSSVEFVIYGNCQIATSRSLTFPSEVIFTGQSGNEYTVTVAISAEGDVPSLIIDSAARVIFNGINISITGTSAELSSLIKGTPSEIIILHGDTILCDNVALLESYYNIDVRLIDSTINNSTEKIFINSGGGEVNITGDGNSTISNPNATDVCYYIATSGSNYSASFL
jgi:hypothetical protein